MWFVHFCVCTLPADYCAVINRKMHHAQFEVPRLNIGLSYYTACGHQSWPYPYVCGQQCLKWHVLSTLLSSYTLFSDSRLGDSSQTIHTGLPLVPHFLYASCLLLGSRLFSDWDVKLFFCNINHRTPGFFFKIRVGKLFFKLFYSFF